MLVQEEFRVNEEMIVCLYECYILLELPIILLVVLPC